MRITDSANGCVTVHSATVIEPAALDISQLVFDSVTCNGGLDGTATAVGITGGNGTNSFSWNTTPVQTTNPATGLSAGTYTLTVTDQKNCSTTGDVEVKEPVSLSINTLAKDLKCFNDGSGAIDVLSVNNGAAPYVYNWTGPNGYNFTTSSSDITNLEAGVYVLSLTDNNLCTLNNDSTTVLEPDTISITYVLTDPSCGTNDGSIEVTPTGGGGAANPLNTYVYSWADLDAGPAVIGTAALLDNIGSGLYEITVTDDSSCVGSQSINISDINGPIVTDSTIDVTCNNDTDGKIYLTVTLQSAGTVYGTDWDIDNFIGATPPDLDGLQDSIVQTDLPPGVYFVRITDSANGCVTVHSDTVFEPGPIVLTPNFDSPSCYGLSNGKAYPENISGGNGGYTYLWSDGQLTDTAFNLGSGSYSLTATDSKSCFNTMSVNITQPDSISISLDQDSVSCFGESNGIAFLDSISGGSGGFSYSWDLFAISQNSSNATNDTAVGLYAGTWELTVEDVNGCKDSLEIEVLQPEVLVIGSMIMDSASCYGAVDGIASANGVTGGNSVFTYSWTNALGTNLLQDNDTAVGLLAGIYTITITDQNNCSATSDIEVKEPNAITIDSIYQDSVRCYGLADGVAVVSNISGGTGSGYNFTWTDSLGNDLSQNSSTAINLSAGVYNITVTDSDACYLDTNVTVLQPNLLAVDTNSQISVTCSGDNDGSAYVAVSGGNGIYNYLWSDGQVTDTANNLVAGTYLVNIKDQKLCSLDTSVTVLEPTPLIVDTTSQDSVLCNGSSGGSAYVAVSGGNGIYDYLWSNGQTSDTASNITAGIYQVTITDQLLCSLDTSMIVLEPDTFVVDTLNIISPYCSSSTDAIINLVVTGGNSPYSFSWSDNSGTFSSNNQNIINVLPGTYYVLVTDNNGCRANDTVTLTPELEIFANAGPEDTLVCFEDSLTLLGTTFGALNPSVSWNLLRNVLSTDSTISYYFDDSATVIYDFIFVVTEQNCIVKDSIKVIVAPFPILDAGNDASIEPGLTFTLGGSPTGPINSSYFWTPLINFYNEADSVNPNPEIEVNSNQLYIVFVTDTNGCKNNDTIKVELVPDIEIPSAFSPNNDGINDSWIIEISELYSNVTLRVYNRWGTLVYDNLNNVVGDYWTGNGKNSKPLTVGTYYFVMEYDGIDGGKNNITGPITIIR